MNGGGLPGNEMRHHTNELSFERPDWLIDRTHHMFAVSTDGPSPFNIVLSRTPLGAETLDEMVDRILKELAARLDGFAPGTRETATVAGVPARVLVFQWDQGGQRLYQRQAVLVREGPGGRALHQIAATASGDARQAHVAGFADLLASLRFRGDEGDGRADDGRADDGRTGDAPAGAGGTGTGG